MKTASGNLCSLATSMKSLKHLLYNVSKPLVSRNKFSKDAPRVHPGAYWAETWLENTAVSFKYSRPSFPSRKKDCCMPESHSGTGLGCGQGTRSDLKARKYYRFSSLAWRLNGNFDNYSGICSKKTADCPCNFHKEDSVDNGSVVISSHLRGHQVPWRGRGHC